MVSIPNFFRWRRIKRRSEAQKSSMQGAWQKRTGMDSGCEQATSDKENKGEVMGNVVELSEWTKRYEKRYRNEKKRTRRITEKLQATKQKLLDIISTRDATKDLLQETQSQLQQKNMWFQTWPAARRLWKNETVVFRSVLAEHVARRTWL